MCGEQGGGDACVASRVVVTPLIDPGTGVLLGAVEALSPPEPGGPPVQREDLLPAAVRHLSAAIHARLFRDHPPDPFL